MKEKRGVRYLILMALRQMEERQGYSQEILDRSLKENPLSSRDRGLFTRIFYGVLQRRGTLDWIIHTFSRKGIQGMDPLLQEILRLGCYQLLYLDRIPPYAAINETVSLTHLCRRRGWASFVNALLWRLHREGVQLPTGDDLETLQVVYSHPPWIIQSFIAKYGLLKTRSLLTANNQISPFHIRVNTLVTCREQLLTVLKGEGLSPQKVHGLPEALRLPRLTSVVQLSSFQAGHFYLQGLGSMVAAHLLGGEAGEDILDLCAGPGGKATHMAQLTSQKARIVALDIHEHRIRQLKENCKRLGIHSIVAHCGDALTYHPHYSFHRVLVDAPCSALGLLASRPEIRWNRSQKHVKSLQVLQRRLLRKGASLLKKGGLLLYCTCTLTQEENEDVVEDFLAQGGFQLLDGEDRLEKKGLDFFPPVRGRGFLEYLPHHQESEGFFLALMEKK